MFKLAKPFFLTVETPLHAGSGSELGVVDLPIQRERHTDFPKIEGSSLKGSIREVFEELESVIFLNNELKGDDLKSAISLDFGPEEGDAHAGALGFTDARLLLFPVKSMKGIFAWVTCPEVLERFKKDLELCKKTKAINIDLSKVIIPQNDKNWITQPKPNTPIGECIAASNKLLLKDHLILEEYSFKNAQNQNITALVSLISTLIGDNKVNDKLAILHNDDFRDFVNLSTEVITRIKINNETGTVETGALFTEEYLPCESILYSLALTTPIFKEKDEEKGVFKKDKNNSEEAKVMEFFTQGLPEVIQVGGNATIGKGLVRIKKIEEVRNGKQN